MDLEWIWIGLGGINGDFGRQDLFALSVVIVHTGPAQEALIQKGRNVTCYIPDPLNIALATHPICNFTYLEPPVTS